MTDTEQIHSMSVLGIDWYDDKKRHSIVEWRHQHNALRIPARQFFFFKSKVCPKTMHMCELESWKGQGLHRTLWVKTTQACMKFELSAVVGISPQAQLGTNNYLCTQNNLHYVLYQEINTVQADLITRVYNYVLNDCSLWKALDEKSKITCDIQIGTNSDSPLYKTYG